MSGRTSILFWVGGVLLPTPRKPTAPTAEAIDQFCAAFDLLFPAREERQALGHYLIGLLLPWEHNKTVVKARPYLDRAYSCRVM